ncbi:hypothetical protein BDV96DRAFT_256342 [Lophiotrema nucula]|uniref:Integral membrane protein n=1 Tax=Lophiotrema nucula TaxID=690887 RepID=A0A6A5YNS9_9PLEO|nr:hypothetical protein BDV96DRAFT_256342 [Lophiotrema nucula]
MAVDQTRLDAALDDASRIRRFSVFIATSLLFCIALISFFVRIALKLHRRPFSLDDIFLASSLVLLIAATGLLYAKLDQFYLGAGLKRDGSLAGIASAGQIKELHSTDLNAIFIAVSILLWIGTSLVKVAFLVLFRPVVRSVKGLAKYWVSALVMVAVALVFWVVASVLLGVNNSPNPFFEDRQLLFLALSYAGTAFDIFSFVVPIYVLVIIGSQETSLYSQKLAPRAFLLLTLLIAIFSVLRNLSFGSRVPLYEDSIWQLFWTYFETGFTILFISLTTYRPMFGGDSPQERKERKKTTQINFIPDPAFQVARPSPTASSFREWGMWWKGSEDGEERSDVGSGKSMHSRSASNLSAKSVGSEGSVRKEMIGVPEFVGGTSDWVMGRTV